MTDHVEVASEEDLWAWLAVHHAQSSSVWLVTWKAQHPKKYLSRDAVLDALIAFGWVDGRRKVLDDDRTMQLIAPRQQQAWAQSYKERAAHLIKEGRMQPSGQAAIDAGRASGLWDYFADVDARIVPDDLAAALAAHPPAATHWQSFAPSKQRNILRWIKIARTAPTRARRIKDTASLAAENRTPPQM